jgi:hypothetical protein
MQLFSRNGATLQKKRELTLKRCIVSPLRDFLILRLLRQPLYFCILITIAIKKQLMRFPKAYNHAS